MIDATQSLLAAEGLSARALASYLRSTGWGSRPARVPGITIFSKELPGVGESIQLILPEVAGFSDEQRRIADALRSMIGRSEQSPTTCGPSATECLLN